MRFYQINANLETIAFPDLLGFLTPEEKQTCFKLVKEKDQYIQAMSYTLQRYALHRYALQRYEENMVELKDIPITRQPGQKPYYTPGGIHYSVSHSQGYIFLVISRSPCGLDVEGPRKNIAALLYRAFALENGTVKHWTMVESCLKYYGCGLSGLSEIAFTNAFQIRFKNEWVNQYDISDVLHLPAGFVGTLTFNL
jgi:phosphopantetheinyl transferase